MAAPRSKLDLCARFAFLALLAVSTPSGVHAAGVNLSWDDCGTAGSGNKTFACATNSGSAALVGSVVAPSGIAELVGMTASLDVWSSPDSVGTPIPDWWLLGTGGCRPVSLSADFTFPATCLDPWFGQAFGGKDYAVGVPSANHVTLRLVCAVPPADSVALTADSEYYVFRVIVNYQKTVGTGSCSGCASPMSIALSYVDLYQAGGLADVTLTAAVSSNVATWQGGAGLSPNGLAPKFVTYGRIRSVYH